MQSGLGFLLVSLSPSVVEKFLDMSNDSGDGGFSVNWDWAFVGPGLAVLAGAIATIFSRGLSAVEGAKRENARLPEGTRVSPPALNRQRPSVE